MQQIEISETCPTCKGKATLYTEAAQQWTGEPGGNGAEYYAHGGDKIGCNGCGMTGAMDTDFNPDGEGIIVYPVWGERGDALHADVAKLDALKTQNSNGGE